MTPAKSLRDVVVIKGRLPLLQAVARELERMEQGRDLRVRNDAVLRVVRDSFDQADACWFPQLPTVQALASIFAGFAADPSTCSEPPGPAERRSGHPQGGGTE